MLRTASRSFTTRCTSTRSSISSSRSFASATSPAPVVTAAAATTSGLSRTRHDLREDRLLVVGSGVAGSAAALVAAEQYGVPVTLLFAGHVPTDCNSYWAQGGIIYRNYDAASGDSAASLAADIQRAGAGLCADDAVWKVATEGPDRVRQLLLNEADSGPYCRVPFERRDDQDGADPRHAFKLCLEASHAAPRILFTGDHTGRSITECLAEAVRRHPLITLQPHTVVTDLVVVGDPGAAGRHCLGVTTLNRATGALGVELAARGTVLCSGGLAGIYQHSTNPAGFNALGSSVALAARAGADTRDLEFVQFHPTALHIPGQPSFLLSEALRGEGARLVNGDGHYFAADYHPDAELAPRDVVARAVFAESQATGATFLDLTATAHSAEYLHRRFPSIQAHLQQPHIQLDLARDRIPVLPAAHYTCGGVVTDAHGATNIHNLYAAGEAARTGLHGGNRLASTSLLEGLVYGAAVADHVGSATTSTQHRASEWLDASQQLLDNKALVYDWIHHASSGAAHVPGHGNDSRIAVPRQRYRLEPHDIESAGYSAMTLLKTLRRCMWDNVGVVRTPLGLEKALDELVGLRREAHELYAMCPTLETAAVRDAAYAGYAVTEAASRNKSSVGAHCVVADESDEEAEDAEPAAL